MSSCEIIWAALSRVYRYPFSQRIFPGLEEDNYILSKCIARNRREAQMRAEIFSCKHDLMLDKLISRVHDHLAMEA